MVFLDIHSGCLISVEMEETRPHLFLAMKKSCPGECFPNLSKPQKWQRYAAWVSDWEAATAKPPRTPQVCPPLQVAHAPVTRAPVSNSSSHTIRSTGRW